MGEKLKILFISNDRPYHNYIRCGLIRRKYGVICTATAQEGLLVAAKVPVDLVLADLDIEDLDGMEMIRRLLAILDTTPIVTISQSKNYKTAFNAFKLGAAGNILSPMENIQDILDDIDRYVAESRTRKKEMLYKKHLEIELERKSRELELRNRQLSNVSRKLYGMIDSINTGNLSIRNAAIGKYILNQLGKELKIGGGSIYIKDTDGLKKIHSLDGNHSPDFIGFPLSEKSPFRNVLATGKSLLVDDIDLRDDLSCSGWDGYETPSLLIFPLADHTGKINGLISLHNKEIPPFLSTDMELGLMISLIYREATRNRTSSEALEISENRYVELTSKSEAIIFSYSIKNKNFNFINDSFTRITGYDKSEVENKSLLEAINFLQVDSPEEAFPSYLKYFTGGISSSGSFFKITARNGNRLELFQKSVVITNSVNIPVTIDGIIYDYSEQRNLETKLSRLNCQKETLLNEINHRTKNNMQIISSLLNLQLSQFDDENSIKILKAAEKRISTIASVHDNIYTSDFMPEISMKSYIINIINNLLDMRKYRPKVGIKIKSDDLTMDLDRAVICGLIINEAVSNSLHHAFPEIDEGLITVEFRQHHDNFRITITDTGNGIDLSSGRDKGLGLDIIENLTLQLNGKLDIINSEGTLIKADFPAKVIKKKGI